MRMYTPWTDRTKSGGNCRDTKRIRFTQGSPKGGECQSRHGSSLDCRRPGGSCHPINTPVPNSRGGICCLAGLAYGILAFEMPTPSAAFGSATAFSNTMRSLLITTYYSPEH